MKKNCLVTTLKAATGNKSLLKVGEMRLEAKTENDKSKRINFSAYPVVIETLDGSMSLTTDKNLLTGLTNKLTITGDDFTFYTKTQNIVLSILNKYKIKSVSCFGTTINLNDLKPCSDFEYLEAVNCKGSLEAIKDKPMKGINTVTFEQEQDIASLSGLTTITRIILNKTANVSGDIASLSGLTALIVLTLVRTNVSGNIASLSGLTELKGLTLSGTPVSGDIASLSGLTALKTLDMYDSGTNVSGDIAGLGRLTALTNLGLYGTSASGEIVDLVISQRSNGRTSGNMAISTNNIITFNGKALISGNYTISWTASSITNETTSETVNR